MKQEQEPASDGKVYPPGSVLPVGVYPPGYGKLVAQEWHPATTPPTPEDFAPTGYVEVRFGNLKIHVQDSGSMNWEGNPGAIWRRVSKPSPTMAQKRVPEQSSDNMSPEAHPEPPPATAEEEIIVNGKPIKVKDIIATMEDEYRERHGLPDPEE